jgi:hypothetical protein
MRRVAIASILLAAVLQVQAATGQPDFGVPDAALTRMFTPIAAPPGEYVVYRSDRPIAAIAAELKGLDPDPSPGAWEPQRPEAHDAFGQEGPYDRSRLARLFRGKRVTLIRGSLTDGPQRVAYTLISPYPSPSLDAIVPGTMVIRYEIRPPQALFSPGGWRRLATVETSFHYVE